jgi:hypothetical protein
MLNLKNQQIPNSVFPPKKEKPPPNSKAEGIKLKGGVMLATKCDLAEISDEDVCYALIWKQVLFSLNDITSFLPPAITNILQMYEDIFSS